MWKQALIASVVASSCVPADPGPTYPPQQQWGQQPPQAYPQPQPQPYPQPQPQPQPYPQPQPQPYPPPPPVQPDPWRFDARGWTLLGAATVDGARDRDVIPVSKYQGRFDQLTMVVYDSDLQLDDLVLTFGNNETFSPGTRATFREGSRSRAIDLPGNDRLIKKIDLRYSNLPGGGRARVEIYGRDTGATRPPPRDDWKFDARGWTLLGSETVDGRHDRDAIKVGKYQGRFDQLTLVVYDSDLQLDDLTITFGNNETFAANVRHLFKEGSRSRAVDLPGDDRLIKRVDLRYSNLPGGGKARVEVYGKDTGKPRPTPPPPDDWKFDTRGWTLLGSETVDGKRDRDTIKVGKYQGKFDQLTMVVYDSDLTLEDLTVTFGDGQTMAPSTRHVFKQGSRSRAIDLPGNDRIIKRIDLRYSNLPGGGKARVELYGRDTGTRPQPAPQPPPDDWKFDARGWTLLGNATVNGKRDRDTIRVGKYQGQFDQLTMVVYDSDLTLEELTVTFGNSETFAATSRHEFKQGSRSRAIDLPGNDRIIKRIELRYSNLPGGGKARVELYGRDTGKRPQPQPQPTPPPDRPDPRPRPDAFDPAGWTSVGTGVVSGADRSVITVGDGGAYRSLLIRVPDSDVTLSDVIITFGNGKTHAAGKLVFARGAQTATIAIPGGARKIKSVELVPAGAPTAGKATVELYARAAATR